MVTLLAVPAPVSRAAAATEPDSLPSPETLESLGAVIGTIEIQVGDVFDTDSPGEDKKPYRIANHLHKNTNESTIRQLLLVKPGDRFSKSQIAESERVLRELRFIYDATIEPVGFDDGVVHLLVRTRDVWTLSAGVSFSHKGGTNSLKFGIEDTNLLGTGKTLKVESKSDVERDSMVFAYRDPALLGGRTRMNLGYTSTSDGEGHLVALERPFYSMDSRWAAGGSWMDDAKVDHLYSAGEVTQAFTHEQQSFSAHGGWSRGLVGDRARRWTAGYTFQSDRFAPAAVRDAGGLPEDRTLSFPWIGLASVQDRYVETRNLNQIGRTEDVALGRSMSLRLGMSLESLGAYRDQAILEGRYAMGLAPSERQLMLFEGHGDGRFGKDATENLLVGGSAQYFLRNWRQNLLFVGLRADAAQHLDPERQLLLGGDSGLRGYPHRYYAGDRRFLFTAEERVFTDWHLFKVLRVGGAAFLDLGSAWFADGDAGSTGARHLRGDAGFGLRLASSRSSRGSMLAIDFAFPLAPDSDIPGMQVVVTTGKDF